MIKIHLYYCLLHLYPSGSQIPTSQRDPYQEHKEDEEDIGDKVGRPHDAVGIVYSIVVKVPKDDPELSETERPGLDFTQSLS